MSTSFFIFSAICSNLHAYMSVKCEKSLCEDMSRSDRICFGFVIDITILTVEHNKSTTVVKISEVR